MEQSELVETNGLENRHALCRRILQDLTIMNDMFMRNVFKKRECTEYVLRVILQQKDLKVVEQVIQKDFKNLQGRSVFMDCVARDSGGGLFNFEIQQENAGASPQRARYHSGLLDMNTLQAGQDFRELPKNCVIFVTRDDRLGRNLPIYHARRKIEETNEELEDGTQIIYVNSGIWDNTELGRLMHDFHCKDAKDMYSTILAERVYELKETPKGVEMMSKEMEELINFGRTEGKAEGKAAGRTEEKMETALYMKEKGYTNETIADLLRVGLDVVQQWFMGTVTVK